MNEIHAVQAQDDSNSIAHPALCFPFYLQSSADSSPAAGGAGGPVKRRRNAAADSDSDADSEPGARRRRIEDEEEDDEGEDLFGDNFKECVSAEPLRLSDSSTPYAGFTTLLSFARSDTLPAETTGTWECLTSTIASIWPMMTRMLLSIQTPEQQPSARWRSGIGVKAEDEGIGESLLRMTSQTVRCCIVTRLHPPRF